MGAFLTGLLGVVVGLVVLGLAGWWWIKRRLRGLGAALAEAMQCGGVPPFRVTLDPTSSPQWSSPETVEAASAALVAAGYERAGDYEVPEMPGVVMRGFANRRAATLAALFEHPGVDVPMLDVARLHEDRRHVLATTVPDQGLEDPPSKATRRLDRRLAAPEDAAEVVGALHAAVLEDSGRSKAIPMSARLFAMAFTTAYAAEMDWRIARGGPTREEILGAARAGGQDAPDDAAVETVQATWRAAIDAFVEEEVLRAFVAKGTVSAAEWERLRERAMVVHEHASVDALIETVVDEVTYSDEYAEADDEVLEARHEAIAREVRSAFGQLDAIRGFARAREAVSALAAYEPVGTVEQPWRGVVYARPAGV